MGLEFLSETLEGSFSIVECDDGAAGGLIWPRGVSTRKPGPALVHHHAQPMAPRLVGSGRGGLVMEIACVCVCASVCVCRIEGVRAEEGLVKCASETS